ncbi:MAG: transporter substrate-binding domain-containing protein [Caldilineaceae bacterium]
MRYLLKPQFFLLSVIAIALVSVGTWAFQFIPDSLLNPSAVPDRTQASTAAIITKRGKLRVGVRRDVRPFGFVDANGELSGFDIDLAHEFARRWLNHEGALELVIVSAADRIPRLTSGDVDLLIAAMPHKRERDALIDFSEPYFVDGQALLTRSDSGIATARDLRDKAVAALQDAPAIDILFQWAEGQSLPIKLVTFPAYPEALDALQTGETDALTADSVTLNQFAQEASNLRLISERFTQEYYAIGLPQGDSQLRALVNFTLQDMKTDGTYDSLYRHWFPADEPLAIELSPGHWPYTAIDQLPADPIPSDPSTVEAILQRGRLRVAIHQDFWPFSSVDSKGDRVGFDLDLVREFARRWLGDENAVEFVVDEPAANIQRLAAGEVDLIAAALVKQREWAEQIDFSQTYIGPPVVSLPLTLGVPQHDSTLRELVNVTLQEMKTDGSYDAIYQQWFGVDTADYPLQMIPGDAGYLLSSLTDQALGPRVTAAGESAIARIRQRNNVLRVGVATTLPPFGYLTPEGQPTGFDIDLAQALAQDWQVQVEFAPVSPADRVAKLLSGEVDLLAAGLLRNKSQEAEIDFSQTYFLGGTGLLAMRSTAIAAITDLQDRVVAVLENTEMSDQLQALAEANGVTVQTATYSTLDAALAALQRGDVAGVLGDSVVLSQVQREEFTMLKDWFTAAPYGLGLPTGDSYFNNLVNTTLQKLKTNGIYDQLYRKWFAPQQRPMRFRCCRGSGHTRFAHHRRRSICRCAQRWNRCKIAAKLLQASSMITNPLGFWIPMPNWSALT